MFPFPAIRLTLASSAVYTKAAYLKKNVWVPVRLLFDVRTLSMKLSRVQPDIYARYAMAKLAREKKVEYGGWVFMGSEPALYSSMARPIHLTHLGPPEIALHWQGRKVLVEVWVYVSVAYQPVSVPLIGELDEDGKNVVIPGVSEQPLLRQLLPLLNWEFTGEIEGHDMGFDKYDPSLETFVPSWMEPTFPIRLSLPLTNVPVLKASYVKMTTFVCNYAEGSQPILPMCSMRHKFINLKWIWPVGLPRRREYVQARWHTVREPVRGLIAVRPDIGEAGCRVTVAPEGFDNTGPGAYWGEDVGAATVSSDEGASDDGDEDGELWN
ncbi:uncharacterized protein B0H18DRAFT_963431 [Fomitopsis serialis]|uniref:uncharacterized protein n=1 Tax=Fomitopsis serialis TaxID=139415 RepID=UPI0020072F19|nr:uncharacterized protein B0H18DRAFT_963431 [Neoantrodia serialis]KAH9910389.1 hypothetical protein B0H18DRAFT_963431 [Neoantrodia serialis]